MRVPILDRGNVLIYLGRAQTMPAVGFDKNGIVGDVLSLEGKKTQLKNLLQFRN